MCREVALGVDLVVHIQRSILGIAQIFLCIGLEYSEGDGLFVFEAGPHLLSLFTVHDCCSRVLAEREFALGCHFRIAQEGQGHILVVCGSLGITQDFGNLLIMGAAQKEAHIAESGVGHKCKSLRSDLENLLALEF